MQNPPLYKQVEKAMKELKVKMSIMGMECGNQLAASLNALKNNDAESAHAIVKRDELIDKLLLEIDQMVRPIITDGNLKTYEQRYLYSGLNIAAYLERISWYGSKIADIITYIDLVDLRDDFETVETHIEEMLATTCHMLSNAMDAVLMQNMKTAHIVWKMRDQIERHHIPMKMAVRKFMKENPQRVNDGTMILFIGKCSNKIGSQIVNIVETLLYIVTGERLMQDPEEMDYSYFKDAPTNYGNTILNTPIDSLEFI